MNLLKSTTAALTALMLMGLVGCGPSSNSPEGLLQQQLDLMNEMAEAMENGKTDAFESLQDRQKALQTKLEEIKPEKEELERLRAKYEQPMKEAAQRLAAAMMKQMGDQMGNLGKQLGNIPMPTP